MNKNSLLIAAITIVLLFMAEIQTFAKPQSCSFSKNVMANGNSYFVSSKRGNGCSVQIVDITLQHNGKKIVHYRTDVDYLAYSAVAADINGDGDAELVVMSKNIEKTGGDTVDVYGLDGNTLKRSSLPPLDDTTGYRGGDSFWVDGKQLVRNFPIYGIDNLQNGTRTLRYEMIDNKLSLYVQTEEQLPVNTASASEQVYTNEDEFVAKVAPTASFSAEISDIAIAENGIIIKTTGSVGAFKVMKLEKPERIAVDFIRGKTGLALKSFVIGKFGVTKVRIGKNKGFLRVVLDSKAKKFPANTVNAVGDAVMIDFSGSKL